MVGFGHRVDHAKAQRPEWAPKYVSYGNLKRTISEFKRAAAISKKEKKEKKDKKGKDSDSDEPPIAVHNPREREMYSALFDPPAGADIRYWYDFFKKCLEYEAVKAASAHGTALSQIRAQVLRLEDLASGKKRWEDTQPDADDLAGSASGHTDLDHHQGTPPTDAFKRRQSHAALVGIVVEPGSADHFMFLEGERDYLTSFASQNRTAIRKIVKKFNKVITQGGLEEQCPRLDGETLLNQFDKTASCPGDPNGRMTVDQLRDPLLHAFAEMHHGEDIAEARHYLSVVHSASPEDMLWLGMALGLLFPSVLVVFVLYWQNNDAVDLDTFWTLLPLYRALILINLWLWVWAFDLMFFHRQLINHTYILEINPRRPLTYVTLLRVAAGHTLLVLINFAVHFWLYGGPHVHYTLFLLWGTVIALLVPLPIFCRDTRQAFLHVCRKLFVLPVWIPIRVVHTYLPKCLQISWRKIPPLQKVRFREFFVADQFTSAVILLADMLYACCFTWCGGWLSSEDSVLAKHLKECQCVEFTNRWKPAVVLWPYVWRFIQCLVMLAVTKTQAHVFNAMKYGTGIVVPLAAVLASTDAGSDTLWVMWVSSVVVSQSYCFVWDVLMDWGCILWCNRRADRQQVGPVGSTTRRHLVPKQYLLTLIPIDFCARATGITTVSEALSPYDTDPRLLLLLLGVIETVRRGLWNIFRMENEQLHNLEAYRASSDAIPPVMSLVYGDRIPWRQQAEEEDFPPYSPVNRHRTYGSTDFRMGSGYGSTELRAGHRSPVTLQRPGSMNAPVFTVPSFSATPP
eukprot:Hpha_TRINITY_DN27427_c0_g1::TRINITY_DN27427_c0_g1_i1::g.193901::m.193901